MEAKPTPTPDSVRPFKNTAAGGAATLAAKKTNGAVSTVEKDKTNGARLGVNVDVVLGILVAALLSWVGIQTHLGALQMREVATTLAIFMPYQTAELKRLGAELEELEDRMRQVENRHAVMENGTREAN